MNVLHHFTCVPILFLCYEHLRINMIGLNICSSKMGGCGLSKTGALCYWITTVNGSVNSIYC